MTTSIQSGTAADLALMEMPIPRLFWRYAVPTIAAMLATGIYVTIDGMFIGHYLGADGLAGITLAYPVGAILYALGTLIGMGGAAQVSLLLGQGKVTDARQVVGNSFTLALICGVTLAIAGTLLSEPILQLLGANGQVLAYARNYLFWYFALGTLPILATTFAAMLRNDGHPGTVTLILIFGGILNTFLDWLFIVVLPFGLAGAAIATMLSHGMTAAFCLRHFFCSRTRLQLNLQQMRLHWHHVKGICRLGLSSMLMSLYLSVVLTLHNIAILWQGTELHLAAYGVIGYTEAMFYLIFEGIALGTQPILSFNTGARQPQRVRQAAKLAFTVTLVTALIGWLIVYGKPQWMLWLFAGDNPQLAPVAIAGMHLYFWGLPFEGMVLVGASLFQAINRPKEAAMLTGSKILLVASLLWLLGALLGITGVWISLSCCSSLLCVWMFRTLKRLDKASN
ncbi:MATE family efflux transporter [Shewanella sp. A32]|uniref:MATE family efflux transporter n=1 Tax=Shewanella sp. A32 TaxID=3031327 RepID=UPI0023B9E5FC|nr:MATE family efflux transporter [Shewanella sp. A32]MDF0532778.1 MATE family efflux transporter [Shewanella sp. A32]